MNRSAKAKQGAVLPLWGALGWIGLLIGGPVYAFRMWRRGRSLGGLRRRLALYGPDDRARFQNRRFVWIHTVSVGELQAARPLLRRLREEFPEYPLLVTTVTDTGQELALQLDEVAEAMYLPLDLYPLCKKALRMVNPVCVAVFETEIWPNFVRAANAHSIPLLLINARVSDRSFKRYRAARFLFGPVLKLFHAIHAQSETDRRRFVEMGAEPDRTFNAGNIKFEAATVPSGDGARDRWRGFFGLSPETIAVVAGSTFPGEERLLARVVKRLRAKNCPLALIAAPRHVERAPSLKAELESGGFTPVFRSGIAGSPSPDEWLFVLDTIGELREVYEAADIVFMGKSLLAKGGQNPLEPAARGRPVLFGPNMRNFRDIAEMLVQNGGARVVNNEEELESSLGELCRDPGLRGRMGAAARKTVAGNQGALERIMPFFRDWLGKTPPGPGA